MLNKSLQEISLYQNKNINDIERLKKLTNNLNKLIKEREQQIKNIVKHTLTDTPEEENIANISYDSIHIDSSISLKCYKFGKYLTILSKQTDGLFSDAYYLLFYDTEQNKISLTQTLPILFIDSKECYYDTFTFYATEKTNIKTIYFMFYVNGSITAPILLYSFDYDAREFKEVETGNEITDEGHKIMKNVIVFDESITNMTKFKTGITNAYLYPYINETDQKTYGYYIFNMTMIDNNLYYLDTNGYKIKKFNITNSKFANISSISFSHDTLFGDNLLFKITYKDGSKLNLSTNAKTLINSKFNIDDSYIFNGELSGTSPSTCNIDGKLLKYLIANNTMYFYNDELKVINEVDITGFDSMDNKTPYLTGAIGINIISSPSLRWYNGIILMISSTSYLTIYKCPHEEKIIMCNNYIYPNGYMFYIIKDDTNKQLKVYKMYPSYGLNLQKTTKVYC